MSRVIAVSLILIVLLAACQPAPEPTPFPLPEPTPEPGSRFYFPLVAGVGRSSKIGLAWASTECGDYEALRAAATWYRGWQSRPNSCPQQWPWVASFPCDVGPDGDEFALWRRRMPADYSGVVIFLNEPDLQGCKRTPDEGAQIWLEFRQICPRCRILSPAVSNEDYDRNGRWVWLPAWRASVIERTGRPPDVYGYDLHSYADTAGRLLERVDALYDLLLAWGEADKPVWVSEFGGCHITPGELWRALDGLEERPFVERAAWFPPRQAKIGQEPPNNCVGLFRPDSRELSEAGRAFAGWRPGGAAYP